MEKTSIMCVMKGTHLSATAASGVVKEVTMILGLLNAKVCGE